MMNFFRKNMKIIFLITITGFIVATFAGFGGYFFTQKYNNAAKVNGKKISKEKLERYTNNLIRNAQTEKDKPLTKDEIIQKKREALQALVQQQILISEAIKTGVDVNEKEIMYVIQNYPIFQKDGKFDHRTYYNTLKYSLRQSPQEFEKSTKDFILTNKIKVMISDFVKASDKEIYDEYSRQKKGDMKSYESEKENFAQQYLSQKKMILLNSWYRHASQNSKIQIYMKE